MFNKIKSIIILVTMNVALGPTEKTLQEEAMSHQESRASSPSSLNKNNMLIVAKSMKETGHVNQNTPEDLLNSWEKLAFAIKAQTVCLSKAKLMQSPINWEVIEKHATESPCLKKWASKDFPYLRLRIIADNPSDILLPATFVDLDNMFREAVFKKSEHGFYSVSVFGGNGFKFASYSTFDNEINTNINNITRDIRNMRLLGQPIPPVIAHESQVPILVLINAIGDLSIRKENDAQLEIMKLSIINIKNKKLPDITRALLNIWSNENNIVRDIKNLEREMGSIECDLKNIMQRRMKLNGKANVSDKLRQELIEEFTALTLQKKNTCSISMILRFKLIKHCRRFVCLIPASLNPSILNPIILNIFTRITSLFY